MLPFPRTGQVFDLRTVLNDLPLRDSACLTLMIEAQDGSGKVRNTIQDSHFLPEELLAIPGWAESQWTFQRETHEWIPVFRAVDDKAVLKLLDVEPSKDHHLYSWLTPKGLPREQYEGS
jgi:hypothetical protein